MCYAYGTTIAQFDRLTGLQAMHAFMSYQTDERATAAKVSELLIKMGITSFMAHEHIEVSVEWRFEIIRQLGLAQLFVAILSKKYYDSIWCKQESGIAAFRAMTIIPPMTIIPLSIDGSKRLQRAKRAKKS